MKHQTSPSEAEFLAGLPRELQELNREMSAIRIEERQSFGPELEAELVREWQKAPMIRERRTVVFRRWLVAACLACLMMGGMAVPAARASVARLVRTVIQETLPGVIPAESEPELPEIRVVEPALRAPQPARANTEVAPPAVDLEEVPSHEETSVFREVAYSYPEILFRQEAENIIASFYPIALQRAGIGGQVALLLWVDASGRVDHIQMSEGSNYQSLNAAAMRAARELRFRPATRAGTPVGTWVEFTVNFVPPGRTDRQRQEPAPMEGPTG